MRSRLKLVLAALCLVSSPAFALNAPIADNLAHDILADDSPTAWKPNAIQIQNYSMEWVGEPIEGVQLVLGRSSFDWVRASDVLILPRARLTIRAKDIEAGTVAHAGASQPLLQEESGEWTAELPVALLTDSQSQVEVRVVRKGKESVGHARFIFNQGTLKPDELFATDPTCSHYEVRAEEVNLASGHAWVMAGCRYVYVEGDEHRSSSLELYLYWTGAAEDLRVNGATIAPVRPGLWLLRLRSRPGIVSVRSGNDSLKLSYRISEFAHYIRFSQGVGPYAFNFSGNGENISTFAPMGSLYGSYYLTEETQITLFGTALLESHWLTSAGLYLRSRSFRFFDRRFSVRLNVGGHFIGFASQGNYFFILRFPQGTELTITDLFGKNRDLSLGAFLYPLINGVSYTELWLRWGSPRLFGEINYIEWNQTAQTVPLNSSGSQLVPFFSRSLGLSVGFPIGGIL